MTLIILIMSVAAGTAIPEAAPVSAPEHSRARLDMEAYLEADPELKAMMEKSIALARQINPDPATNPIGSVDDLYEYIDWLTTCMPWNVLTDAEYPSLYDNIDQSVDYFWFLVDQPLEELEGRGYYYPTLQYHEPIAAWLRDYSDEWGAFLSTEESWNDFYWQRIKSDPTMNMQYGWYSGENVWTTFNDWFSRRLIDPSVPLRTAKWYPRRIPNPRASGPLTKTEILSMRKAYRSSPPISSPSPSCWARIPHTGTLFAAVR